MFRLQEESYPVPAKRSGSTKVGDQPVLAKRTVQDDSPTPAKRNNQSPIPANRTSITKSDSSPTTVTKSSNQNVEIEETQPTPPPRKKKLLKQKLKEQEESGKLVDGGLVSEPVGDVANEPEHSPRRPKRRNKYFK